MRVSERRESGKEKECTRFSSMNLTGERVISALGANGSKVQREYGGGNGKGVRHPVLNEELVKT